MNNQYFNIDNEKNSEHKSKKGKSIFLVLLLSILISAITLGVLYYTNIIEFKNNNAEEPKVGEKNEQKDDNKKEEDKDVSLYFDSKNIINENQFNYELSQSIAGIHTEDFYESQNTVKLVFNWNTTTEYFNLTGNYNKPENITLTFSKKVEEVYADELDNSVDSAVFLFLMEDGTVEYLPIEKAIKDNNYKSYGTIKGVEDIVRFYSTVKTPKVGEVGSNYATLAQRKDGKLYDLSKILIDGGYIY